MKESVRFVPVFLDFRPPTLQSYSSCTHTSLTLVLLLFPEKKSFVLTTNVLPLSENILRALGEGQHGAVPSHSV